MVYFCDTCFTFFTLNSYEHTAPLEKFYNESRCPNFYFSKDCKGSLRKIDRNIAQAIMMLNEKGYYTEDCYSGDIYFSKESNTPLYVSFKKRYCFKNIPKDFEVEEVENYDSNNDNQVYYTTTILSNEVRLKEDTIKEKTNCQNQLWEYAKSFLNWANELPTIKYTPIKNTYGIE